MQYLYTIKNKIVDTLSNTFSTSDAGVSNPEFAQSTDEEFNEEAVKRAEAIQSVRVFHNAVVHRLSLFRNIKNVIDLDELKEPLLYVPKNKKPKDEPPINPKIFYQNVTILDRILGMIGAHRFNSVHENFIIGCCLYFETEGDDMGLLLWLKHLKCHKDYHQIYNKVRKFYNEYENCTYELCVLTLIYMAAIDSPDDFQRLCDKGYID